MNDQLWSWLLTAVGLSCFWLAGRRVWWCWYIGLGGQWTREHRAKENDPVTAEEDQ